MYAKKFNHAIRIQIVSIQSLALTIYMHFYNYQYIELLNLNVFIKRSHAVSCFFKWYSVIQLCFLSIRFSSVKFSKMLYFASNLRNFGKEKLL